MSPRQRVRLPRSPAASSIGSAAAMRANRHRNTGPERTLRGALAARGVRGYRVNLGTAPGRPDIAFTRTKLAVFVHGCFWHRCPHCRLELPKSHRAFWRRKFELNAERDERKRRELEAAGWEVLEFWECEVERDAGSCARRVESTLIRILRHLEADEEQAEVAAVRRRVKRRKSRGRG